MAVGILSEWSNNGVDGVRGVIPAGILGFLPFFLVRVLVEPNGIRTTFVKQVSWLAALVSIFNLYEFRMGTNPVRSFFDSIFVAQRQTWVVQLRWGFARAAGPFSNTILGGVVVSVALLFSLWLAHQKVWRGRWAGVPYGKQIFASCALVIGLLITMSRGPWMGCILGMAVASGGLIKSGRKALLLGGAALCLFAAVAGVFISQYSAVSRDKAETAEQETAAYRRELIDLYVPVIMERPWLGWSLKFPKAQYADSVDNEYLFVALMRGIPGFLCFTAMAGLALFRVASRIWQQSLSDVDRSWAFLLLGGLLCVLGAISTVFLGEQLAVLYNVLLGLADGFVLQRSFAATSRQNVQRAPRPTLVFAQVIR